MTDKPPVPDPETEEDLEANREFYERRVEFRNEIAEGFMGSASLPREPSDAAVEMFHEAMTEHGAPGVEYAQEALHGNGEYFDDFFDSVEEMRDDLQLFKEHSDEQ